jgi:hypothetical protein
MAPPIACCLAVPEGVYQEYLNASAGSWLNNVLEHTIPAITKNAFFISDV